MGFRARFARLAISITLALAMAALAHMPGPSEVGAAARLTGVAPRDEVTGCRSRHDCGAPLRGGLRIAFTGWACTSGFLARHPAAPRWYLLTAGHCLADSGLLAKWSHGGRDVGRAAFHAFRQGSSADVGAIEIDQGQASSQVLGSTTGDVLTVAGWAPDSSQTVGSPVCRSGATSGWTCGSIVAADVDVRVRGSLIRHTWWTDFPSAAGDSGAPLVDRQGRALGVLIATTATQSVYSTIDGIAAELHLRPCLPEGCD